MTALLLAASVSVSTINSQAGSVSGVKSFTFGNEWLGIDGTCATTAENGSYSVAFWGIRIPSLSGGAPNYANTTLTANSKVKVLTYSVPVVDFTGSATVFNGVPTAYVGITLLGYHADSGTQSATFRYNPTIPSISKEGSYPYYGFVIPITFKPRIAGNASIDCTLRLDGTRVEASGKADVWATCAVGRSRGLASALGQVPLQ